MVFFPGFKQTENLNLGERSLKVTPFTGSWLWFNPEGFLTVCEKTDLLLNYVQNQLQTKPVPRPKLSGLSSKSRVEPKLRLQENAAEILPINQ